MKSSIGLILLAAGLSHGGTILLQSGVSAGEYNNFNMEGNYVLTSLHPDWAPDQDGASWVSYENTGFSATAPDYAVIALPNSTGENDPNAIFYQTFTDTTSVLSLTITVWADDTAVLFLDGQQISANANFSQSSSAYCAPTGISCSGAGTTFTIDDIAPGSHTLQFDVYQTGGGTYGVMYSGEVTDLAPEPGSYILLGAGLVAMALFRVKTRFLIH
jgi:hypothetical protein